MRSRASSGGSSDSSPRLGSGRFGASDSDDSDNGGSRRSSDPAVRSHARRRRGAGRKVDEPSLLGSIGKLVRLAMVALVLALVVPFLRTRLFGSRGSASTANATLDRAAKHPYHHAGLVEAVKDAASASSSEPDVFNFRHADYLNQPRTRTPTPSNSALIPQPQQQQRQAPHDQPKVTQVKAPRSRQRKSDDEEEEDASGALMQLVAVGSTGWTVVSTVVRFVGVPFRLVGRGAWYGVAWCWSTFRIALSHTLQPVAYALAPLSYLVSGVLYVFVHVPLGLLSAIVTELYPVYIFLGAATVVGITMGLVAAAVLYITAFLFVDRIPSSTQLHSTSTSAKMNPNLDQPWPHSPSPPSPFGRQHHSPYSPYPPFPSAAAPQSSYG